MAFESAKENEQRHEDYQARFAREKNEVVAQMVKDYSRSDAPLEPHIVEQTIEGYVRELVKDRSFFTLTAEEKKNMLNSPAFDPRAAEETEILARRSAIKEAVREVEKIIEEKNNR
ncbi:MAG: hypothetical protein A3G52_03235 [Candidatus Taylorbacteria bacterium RIFCSPLOWO2_12_FULL_43_20]|uniref:Uncharacterized protein n=1 Tax=Candidatus Taylorbacteria bacterium RIFCSPLOWO2_12_FULL_43_20 TaxID=1802332 RepID=A0A1G2P5E3_9BACT|nr:MAG: hypothetical protein A2825_03615 [Candidatus Taylorbacteria bacterium RIFCSPHIGHO2_01_FULL_43_120]OHA22037.1 MAG: hypothetical protein A3B98_04000 [Candidatus Taylorbacteria bacterium RIFCSPHIGHO2_02_FULL_43_55]OHA30384.1 MAG: hypothetical protein A3E92_00775 [Candidatus Taylorbacteria bacterium RIFCSPHIGHO2_12_FULL_42_34]OHA31534.1 MAG: hypothetical protein A3B09_00720 [Candidatus Taylorbacteria bacterium RIFCSPLOWO2_01_FULL_43_83]OHA39754.1 MAG: hypothetical protein A3H58_04855 [Candi